MSATDHGDWVKEEPVERLRIRAAEPDDAAAISELNSAPEVVYGTLQLPYQPLRFWQERLNNQMTGHHHLVAELDGRVVGSLGLTVMQSPRRRHAGDLGMSVAPDLHGRGIGTALMRAALDLADNWYNLHRLQLEVYADNAVAIHLYQKHGFVAEGTLRDYAFRAGSYVDALVMGRVRGNSSGESG